jgi:hypothetical protein
MTSTSDLRHSGKIRDPLFLCTIGAVALALMTSVALRLFVVGYGPAGAQAEEVQPLEYPTGNSAPKPAK